MTPKGRSWVGVWKGPDAADSLVFIPMLIGNSYACISWGLKSRPTGPQPGCLCLSPAMNVNFLLMRPFLPASLHTALLLVWRAFYYHEPYLCLRL